MGQVMLGSTRNLIGEERSCLAELIQRMEFSGLDMAVEASNSRLYPLSVQDRILEKNVEVLI